MHRKTAFIQNQLSQSVADEISSPAPEYLGGLPDTPEMKAAVKSEVKKRNRRRGKKRA